MAIIFLQNRKSRNSFIFTVVVSQCLQKFTKHESTALLPFSYFYETNRDQILNVPNQ